MSTDLKRRQGTEVRRAQIARAAGALMVRNGSEHMTIKEIAREVGLSEGAIYRHFKTKCDILSLMVEHIEKALSEDIDKSLSSKRTPMQALEQVFRNHISSIEERRGVSFQVIAEVISLGDKRLNRQVFEALDRYRSRIRDILAAGIEAEEIREDLDPEAAAFLVATTIQGLVNAWSLSNYEFDLEERYVLLWDILSQAFVREEVKQTGVDSLIHSERDDTPARVTDRR